MQDSDHHTLTIRRIDHVDDPLFDGFVSTYREAFGGPPYFETYTPEQIRQNVWTPHLDQCILVATTDQYPMGSPESVLGLACCHGVLAPTEPKIRDYLLPRLESAGLFDPRKAIFMSELAVRDAVRRNGLGLSLVRERFHWGRDSGHTHYIMRTAAAGSNSRRLYERIGSKIAPFVQDVSEGDSASKSRIYMYGSIKDALSQWSDF